MAYITGSATDIDQVRTAIVSASTLMGWTWQDEVLSRAGVFIQMKIKSGHLCLRGQIDQTGTGLVTADMGIGPYPHANSPALTWPVAYHIFTFADEIYFVMRYGIGVYQFLAFGKSTILGLPGSGGWYSASGSMIGMNDPVVMEYIGTSGYSRMPGAMFFGNNHMRYAMYEGGFVDSGLDGLRWPTTSVMLGTGAIMRPLMEVALSEYTSESALLPIRTYQQRLEDKISLILELQHARMMNITNVEPEQIITLGNDRWMCFPWYRKAATFGGSNSGPLGWAVRYEGP